MHTLGRVTTGSGGAISHTRANSLVERAGSSTHQRIDITAPHAEVNAQGAKMDEQRLKKLAELGDEDAEKALHRLKRRRSTSKPLPHGLGIDPRSFEHLADRMRELKKAFENLEVKLPMD